MSEDKPPSLKESLQQVLAENDRGGKYTAPAGGLYPHQWLWDSAFTAIGIAHYDVDRAQQEILSILRGQWANGMIPHMIFDSGFSHRQEREVWRSYISPYAPDDVATSGITQPPMLAEAIVQVGKHMKMSERRTWYKHVFQALVDYHQWMYAERDPHQEGLTLQIHPWETGMDNTPPWMYELHQHQPATWIRIVDKLQLDKFLTFLRKDSRYAMPGERLSTLDALTLYSVQRRLRRKQYDVQKIISHGHFVIEDLAFNCIFIRANKHLRTMAKTIGKDLPEDLQENMKKSEKALEQLWDAYSSMYYCRNFITHKLIKIPTIATLLPLYSGCIDKDRAKQLVALMTTSKQFKPKYPVPTVPTTSEYFNEHRYWQGPTWINMNWLIINGLEQYGEKDLAAKLTKSSLELVEKNGPSEYFSPLDGSPAGVDNFSWTAALSIDLLEK